MVPPVSGSTGDMEHNTNSRSPPPVGYTMHGSDAIRLPSIPGELSQQIAKYDSSEFDDDKEVAGGDATAAALQRFTADSQSSSIERTPTD